MLVDIWIEGSIQVLILPDGRYEARIRFKDSDLIRIATGSTPSEAIVDALK